MANDLGLTPRYTYTLLSEQYADVRREQFRKIQQLNQYKDSITLAAFNRPGFN